MIDARDDKFAPLGAAQNHAVARAALLGVALALGRSGPPAATEAPSDRFQGSPRRTVPVVMTSHETSLDPARHAHGTPRLDGPGLSGRVADVLVVGGLGTNPGS